MDGEIHDSREIDGLMRMVMDGKVWMSVNGEDWFLPVEPKFQSEYSKPELIPTPPSDIMARILDESDADGVPAAEAKCAIPDKFAPLLCFDEQGRVICDYSRLIKALRKTANEARGCKEYIIDNYFNLLADELEKP